MDNDLPLFQAKPEGNDQPVASADRFRGAMLFGAVGDALGWPTEFVSPELGRKPPFELPVRAFVQWTKMVGGRWWGYRDVILPGQYSDDTQLTLAVARSISASGDFQPERFAYFELPLWLHYERGGGKSVKTAARSLLQKKSSWLHNFYHSGTVDYRRAGANGAAMRNLPIALSSGTSERRLVRDSFLNAVITHGHPRAILGAILFAHSVRFALGEEPLRPKSMIDYLLTSIESAGRTVADDHHINAWIHSWEKDAGAQCGAFKSLFAESRKEAHEYLTRIPEFAERPSAQYYETVGATSPETKGSGLSSVCAAIYSFLKDGHDPAARLYDAVNLIGSDTDTIASFVGALLGARHGLSAVPAHLADKVQDREYLLKIATWLHKIAAKEPTEQVEAGKALDKRTALTNILAWEMGLHEMFWDAIEEGGTVVHPTLGRGKVGRKEVRQIARAGYVAKLIHIAFDCGQTCVFHSRVQNNIKVFESLGLEVEKALTTTK